MADPPPYLDPITAVIVLREIFDDGRFTRWCKLGRSVDSNKRLTFKGD
jgi:hypothetical protein